MLDIVLHLPFTWRDAAFFGAGLLSLPVLVFFVVALSAVVDP